MIPERICKNCKWWTDKVTPRHRITNRSTVRLCRAWYPAAPRDRSANYSCSMFFSAKKDGSNRILDNIDILLREIM